MLRLFVVFAGAIALWSVAATNAQAQDFNPWPSTGTFLRGTGFYLSPTKVIGAWIRCWLSLN